MVDIMKYNKLKLNDLSRNIIECNGDYRLFCFDVDDVIFNTAPIMQMILESIDRRATKKYRVEKQSETSQTAKEANKRSYTLLDAILEERTCTIENEKGQNEHLDFTKPLIDYEELYSDKYLFPLAIEFIKYMIATKGENDFFIFVSHRNPEREGEVKTRRLYELLPEIDGVITLPFHEKVGADEPTNKGIWVKNILGLDNLDNAILIDNDPTNGKRFRKLNGFDIRYLPEGFKDEHTLYDHMSKLTNLDPYMINFILTLIKYSRENPEYAEELDKVKIKKL